MKRLILLLTIAFSITFCSTLLAIEDNKNEDIYRKVILATGMNDIANIAKLDIIPKLRFLLFTLPDSVWGKYEIEYDSAKLYMEISKNLQSHFSPQEAQKYYHMAQILLEDFTDTSYSKFEYFLSKMDSLDLVKAETDSLIDKPRKEILELERNFFNKLIDSLKIKLFFKIDTIRIRPLTEDKILKNDFCDSLRTVFHNLDSLLLKYFGISLKWDSLRKEFYLFPPYQSDTFNFELKLPDTLIFRERKIFPDSATKFLFLDTSNFIFNLKELENYSKKLKEYSNLLNEYFKLWELYIDSLSSYYRNSFELLRKFSSNESKNKETEKELEKLTKEFEQFYKSLLEEYKNLLKKYKYELEINKELLNKEIEKWNFDLGSQLGLQIDELKRLMQKHKEFIEDLSKMKKQIEIEILNDLKNRGYINE